MNIEKKAHSLCIYCLRTEDDVDFNREHIIPQNVGGTLFVDGMVCKDCNSELGRQVDCELLKVPDIINAMEKLGIGYNREGVLRNYYETRLVSLSGSFKAMPVPGGFALLPQVTSDGSRIAPDHSSLEGIKKSILRENRGSGTALSESATQQLLADFNNRLQEAPPENLVVSEELGLTVVNRTEVMKSEAKPKSRAEIERIVGKIALEWLFSLFGRSLLKAAPWVVDLRNLVCTGKISPGLLVFRSEPPDKTIRKKHYLYVLILSSMTKVVFGAFGGIEYTLVAPVTDQAVLSDFSTMVGASDLIGVAFEQDLENPAKRFFALKKNGESLCLGEL